jgi:hypothetical protein
MVIGSSNLQTPARLALAAIRLTVGTTALFAPRMFARRLDVDPDAQPAILYVARMFGIRTIFIGADILVRDEALRNQALRAGVIIHISDATAAAIAGLRRQIPPRAAFMAMLLSSINATLAVIARRGKS